MQDQSIIRQDLEMLKTAISKNMGIYVTDVEPEKGRITAYFFAPSTDNEATLRMSYKDALQHLQIYKKKTETIANIDLAMSRGIEAHFFAGNGVTLNGDHSYLHTVPAHLMHGLREGIRVGAITPQQYVNKARRLTGDELYSIPLEGLKKIELDVREHWEPGTVAIIPQITKKEIDEMLSRDWVFDRERAEFFRNVQPFNVDRMELVPASLLEPPEIRDLSNGNWEKVARAVTYGLEPDGSLGLFGVNEATIDRLIYRFPEGDGELGLPELEIEEDVIGEDEIGKGELEEEEE